MKAGCAFVVMEVSSHAIAQERIAGINFFVKVHTNITQDHLDFHKNIEAYRAVKNSFFQDDGLKVINSDDPFVKYNPTNALTYALKDDATLLKGLHYRCDKRGIQGTITDKTTSQE